MAHKAQLSQHEALVAHKLRFQAVIFTAEHVEELQTTRVRATRELPAEGAFATRRRLFSALKAVEDVDDVARTTLRFLQLGR
jgi:hypothetical protein